LIFAPLPSTALAFTLEVERYYAALIGSAANVAVPSLGGKLLYAGQLDSEARALVVAANITGAASLTATADPSAQKQAIRDGVADFLVNSLDEAVRILKNEIRKRETVAVCIAAAPEAVEREMRERGVEPDVGWPIAGLASTIQKLVVWRVAESPAQWLPRLDAIALSCLEANPDSATNAARRWLRQAPRYLGRLAQGLRVLRCNPEVGREFTSRIRSAIEDGEIATAVEIALGQRAETILLQPAAGEAD
jgi:hypothetical protein